MRFARVPFWRLAAAIALAAVAPARAAGPDAAPVFSGMCDASAGVFLAADLVAVANDEDNVLRIYDVRKGGTPAKELDLDAFLRLEEKHPEVDLEGAALLADRIYWIGSHGRNKDGKLRPNRRRLFATGIERTDAGPRLAPAGRAYSALLDDMLADARLAGLGLKEASALPPKAPGGLNIEALCAAPDGALLVGFRNPTPKGKALVVPLLNPAAAVEGRRAELGEPQLIELGGLGIRDMTREGQGYLILAGPTGEEGGFRLFRWDGTGAAPSEIAVEGLEGYSPEALVPHPSVPGRHLVLSDDGTRPVGGVPCKTVRDPRARQFRGVWIDLPAAGPPAGDAAGSGPAPSQAPPSSTPPTPRPPQPPARSSGPSASIRSIPSPNPGLSH